MITVFRRCLYHWPKDISSESAGRVPLSAMSAVDRSIPTPGTEPGLQVYRRSFRTPDTWVQRVRHWYPEQVTAAQVRADPGGYILCMSFFDSTELVDIDPASGVWIYSSSEPHNEEQQFELRRPQTGWSASTSFRSG